MSEQEGSTVTNLRDLYRKLGVPTTLVDKAIDVLTHVEKYEDLEGEMDARQFTVDQEQFFLPLFRPLYQSYPEIKAASLERLVRTGITRRLVDKYLTRMGNQPAGIFRWDHERKLPANVIMGFIDEARRLMFETLKERLGSAPLERTPESAERERLARDAAKVMLGFPDNKIRQIVLFGSVARGTARPESDIDLCLVFDEGLSNNRFLPIAGTLRDLLEEKGFQIGTHIPMALDFSFIREDYFNSDNPPALMRGHIGAIKKEGIVLYPDNTPAAPSL